MGTDVAEPLVFVLEAVRERSGVISVSRPMEPGFLFSALVSVHLGRHGVLPLPLGMAPSPTGIYVSWRDTSTIL